MSFDVEAYRLIKENNEMLKRICRWLDKIESDEYRMGEDIKSLAINIMADLGANNMSKRTNLQR